MSMLGAVRNLLGIKGADGSTIVSTTNRLPTDAVLSGRSAAYPFEGTAGVKGMRFPEPMTSLVVSNDGASPLTVRANGFDFEVKAGEVFDESFAPFTSALVLSDNDVPFRAYARGSDDTDGDGIVTEYQATPGAPTIISTSPNTYKGNSWTMNDTRTLLNIGVYGGDPTAWELWERVSQQLSGTALTSGSFDGTTDAGGYSIATLDTPYELAEGTEYVLIVTYGGTENGQRLVWTDGRHDYPVVDHETFTMPKRSFAQDTPPAAGDSTGGSQVVYDFKLGLER